MDILNRNIKISLLGEATTMPGATESVISGSGVAGDDDDDDDDVGEQSGNGNVEYEKRKDKGMIRDHTRVSYISKVITTKFDINRIPLMASTTQSLMSIIILNFLFSSVLSQYNFYDGKDCPYYDIKTLGKTNLFECLEACNQNDKCKSVQFNKRNRCYLNDIICAGYDRMLSIRPNIR